MKKTTWVGYFAVVLFALSIVAALIAGAQFPAINPYSPTKQSFNYVLAISVFVAGSMTSLLFLILSWLLERQHELHDQLLRIQATRDYSTQEVKTEIMRKPAAKAKQVKAEVTEAKSDKPALNQDQQHAQDLEEILAELDHRNRVGK